MMTRVSGVRERGRSRPAGQGGRRRFGQRPVGDQKRTALNGCALGVMGCCDIGEGLVMSVMAEFLVLG